MNDRPVPVALSAIGGAYSVPSSSATDLERYCGFAERFLTDESGRRS
jgi:hypothetical protein